MRATMIDCYESWSFLWDVEQMFSLMWADLQWLQCQQKRRWKNVIGQRAKMSLGVLREPIITTCVSIPGLWNIDRLQFLTLFLYCLQKKSKFFKFGAWEVHLLFPIFVIMLLILPSTLLQLLLDIFRGWKVFANTWWEPY